jgi:protein-tyrosine phosphatase
MALGRLFRADDPIRLTDSGRQTVAGLGLAAVIDVRQEQQFRRSAGFCEPDRTVHLPLVDQVIDRASPPPLRSPEHLTDVYESMLHQAGASFAQALDVMAERLQAGPVLVHCAFGKDRTGLIVAMIQALLGVSVDDIVAEYAHSDDPARARRRWLLAEPRPDDPDIAAVPEMLFRAPAETMSILMQRVVDHHGSPEAWVRTLPLHPSTPDLFERALVVT